MDEKTNYTTGYDDNGFISGYKALFNTSRVITGIENTIYFVKRHKLPLFATGVLGAIGALGFTYAHDIGRYLGGKQSTAQTELYTPDVSEATISSAATTSPESLEETVKTP